RFFRQFASEVFHTAASVVGAATALQRTSAEAASAILNPPEARPDGFDSPRTPALPASEAWSGETVSGPARSAPRSSVTFPAAGVHSPAPVGYHSAFRVDGDRIVLL